MKIRVDVKLPNADPLVQFLDVPESRRFGSIQMRQVATTQRAESLVRTIQRRYPKATITWREVEDAA